MHLLTSTQQVFSTHYPLQKPSSAMLHALTTFTIQNAHYPSSTVHTYTTKNFSIEKSGQRAQCFITVLIPHITHCHDSFAILRTLSILKIHNFHFIQYLHPVSTILTLHTVHNPAFSHPTATYSSRIPRIAQ
ncbi:hypothetical protein AVEN_109383-1 [Araneus ventricosus]|uniref:Uncharacterized protein n=1 Tax=Araneus ventricosus TaxID=182803 RepID=A0A4Y2J8H2_ARAVE|nr:hypothetical protein AVEN_109383-1 [Araneus ventricosus]